VTIVKSALDPIAFEVSQVCACVSARTSGTSPPNRARCACEVPHGIEKIPDASNFRYPSFTDRRRTFFAR